MIMLIFSVKDKAVDAFLQPFFSPTLASATRAVRAAVNDPNHEFSKHINDYSLFQLGSFDDSSGELVPLDDGPKYICPLGALVEKSN